MRYRRLKKTLLYAGGLIPGVGCICGDELGSGKYNKPHSSGTPISVYEARGWLDAASLYPRDSEGWRVCMAQVEKVLNG